MIIIMSSVLLVCLFQENKSYGSKKPFAFILWCIRKSCRAHCWILTVLNAFMSWSPFKYMWVVLIFWESFFSCKICFIILFKSFFVFFGVRVFKAHALPFPYKALHILEHVSVHCTVMSYRGALSCVWKYFQMSRMSLFSVMDGVQYLLSFPNHFISWSTFLYDCFQTAQSFPIRVLSFHRVLSGMMAFASKSFSYLSPFLRWSPYLCVQ